MDLLTTPFTQFGGDDAQWEDEEDDDDDDDGPQCPTQ
jgi:hypothetical protein